MDDRIGQQLGNYRLIDRLRESSLGEFYLGEHIHLNTLAAIDVLNTPLDNTSIFWFRRHAQTLATLAHPNIRRVLDFGISEENIAFLVLAYAPGGQISLIYPKGSRLSTVVILPYVKQLCSALQNMHNHNMIHCDLKPAHLLVGENGEIVVDGFDLAVSMHGTSSMEIGEYRGTMPYSAPEQIQGKPRRESDQYALGIIIYEWLTGERPFTGGTLIEIISQHLNELPRPLREKIPDIPPAIEQVVLKALAKDPQQRFPSMQDFANAFEHACSPEQATLATSKKLQPVSPSLTSMEVSAPTKGIRLFFSYAHKDEKLRNELAKRLTLLKRNGLITDWYDRDIDAGAEWAREIDTRLNDSDIILLLVSPDFIASDYCYNLEMMRALERHEAGEASVIPIILRPVTWKETPFGKFQALPEGGRPVTAWSNRDEAFLHVATGIQKVVEKLNKKNLG